MPAPEFVEVCLRIGISPWLHLLYAVVVPYTGQGTFFADTSIFVSAISGVSPHGERFVQVELTAPQGCGTNTPLCVLARIPHEMLIRTSSECVVTPWSLQHHLVFVYSS